MKIIDTHVYSLPARLRDLQLKVGKEDEPILNAIHRHSEGEMALKLSNPDEILKSMNSAGISHSVLVSFPWADFNLCKENNQHVLHFAKKDPEHFSALCSVQPLHANAVDEVKRVLDSGAIGIKMNGAWQGYELKPKLIESLVSIVQKFNAYFLIHVDQVFRKNSPTSPGHLFEVLKAYPNVKIVGAHMAGQLGVYNKMESVSQNFKNFYCDTAVSETLEMVNFAVDAGFEDHIVFGSDFPFNACHDQKSVVDRLNQRGLAPAVLDKIYFKNFERLRSA